MDGVNKVILVGNLGAKPEIKFLENDNVVCNFSVATGESWKDKTGNKQNKTTWHRIVTWGKLAEICGEYLNKGSMVYLEGKIDIEEWEDKEGNTRYTTKIVCNQMRMLGGNARSDDEAEEEPAKEAASDFDDVPF